MANLNKKFSLIFILIICSTLILTSCSYDKSGLKKIKVSEVTRSIFYAPQYVAISQGFFEDQGLKLDLSTGDGADKVMAGVLSGNIDIGFAGSEAAIYVFNEGKEDYVEIFAQLTKRDGSFLVGREKSENFDYNELKGKTILPGRKGGVPFMTLEYILKQKNLIPGGNINLDNSIQFSLMSSSFASGIGDYVTLFEPAASIIEKQNRGHILTSIGKDSKEVPYTTYFAKKSFISKNQDIIKSFTTAVYKGMQWVLSHSAQEIAKEIISFFPDGDIEILTTAIDRYKQVDVWNNNPYITQESFNNIQDIMQQAGELEKRAPYEKVVNNSFNQEFLN